MRLTLVRTRPPRQLVIPALRWWDQSPCILENASCICSGFKLVLASGGAKNSDETGSGVSSSLSSSPRRRLVLLSRPAIGALRFEVVVIVSRRYASSRDFFTVKPASVRDRTISKARKPTMSTVSSLALRSNCGGKLRNSRNRFARRTSVASSQTDKITLADLFDMWKRPADSLSNVGILL